MRTAIFSGIAICLVAAPCGAVTISIGNETGYPGQEVNVPVNMSPSQEYGGFEFVFEYNDSYLDFRGFSLSSAANANSIDVDVNERYSGKVEINAGGTITGGGQDFGRAGDLKFVVSSNAPLGTRFKLEMDSRASFDWIGGSGGTASTSDGSITIERDPDAIPTGPRPDLRLTMDSASILIHGQEPIVEFELTLRSGDGQEWLDWPADAYLAVGLPDGRFFYVDRNMRLTPKKTPIRSDIGLEDMDGRIGFGPLPDTAPIGEYTFYGVFTFVDKDPLKSSDENRITGVDKTRFELIPAPTPTPTVTP